MSFSDPREWLANHPKILAALFTLALLLAQAQSAAAGWAGTFAHANPGSP